MKSRPVMLDGADVRAILNNLKTVIVVPIRACPILQNRGTPCIENRELNVGIYGDYVWSMRRRDAGWCDYTAEKFVTLSPFGVPGDRLWVREKWCIAAPTVPPPTDGRPFQDGIWNWYAATDEVDFKNNRSPWRSPTNMPRSAARIELDVVSVAARRLKRLGLRDTQAFGIQHERSGGMSPGGNGYFSFDGNHKKSWPNEVLESLWDERYGGTVFSYEKNPYVWIVEVRRSLPEVP